MLETDILDGVGNEVVYFFGKMIRKLNLETISLMLLFSVFLVLLLVIVIAWYSTYVVEPVVQSVILVERSPVSGSGGNDEINSSTVEEVRQAVTQFLQQQQLETPDTEIQSSESSEQLEQVYKG